MPTTKQLFRNWACEDLLKINPIDRYGDEHLSYDEILARKDLIEQKKFLERHKDIIQQMPNGEEVLKIETQRISKELNK